VTLRCLLVDDNREFLDAARTLLEREGVVVAGTASRIADAVGLAADLGPDVTLADVNLGGENGFELAELLYPSPVIMISTHAAEDYEDRLEDGSAIGFLAKTALSGDAVRGLLSGTRGRSAPPAPGGGGRRSPAG
jgi:DNA-binding NarL/FixJ family response regulator